MMAMVGRHDFWDWDTIFYKATDEVKTPPFHHDLIAFFENPNEFAAAAAPRGHAKTTRVSVRHNLWLMLYATEPYILQVSDTYAHACDVLSAIKYKLGDPLIQKIYGTKFIRERDDDLIIETMYGRSRMRAMGKGGPIRGLLSETEDRPTWVLCDDLERDERVDNPDLRLDDWIWFLKELVPCRAKGGRLRVVGTILHRDSLLQKLLDHPDWETRLWKAIPEEGKSLWPEMYSFEELMKILETYKRAGQQHVFYCEYMNDPVDPDNIEFQRNWIRRTTLAPETFRNLIVTTTVDLAISSKDSACYTAIVTCAWGRDAPSNIYILDARRGRWGTYETVEQLHNVAARYRPMKIGIEQGMLKLALDPIFAREKHRDAERLKITPLQAKGDKDARIRASFMPFALGQVWFVGEHPELEEEFTTFPGSVTKDLMDAWAMQLQLNSVTSALPEPPVKRDSGAFLIDSVLKPKRSHYLMGD